MGCCRLRKCCCCLGLETGTKVIGAVQILFGSLALVATITVLHTTVFGVLEDVFAILLGLFLIAAAVLRNIVMLKIYLAVNVLQMLAALVSLVLSSVEADKQVRVNGGDDSAVAVAIGTMAAIWIFALSIVFYFWLVVYSFHLDLKDEKDKGVSPSAP